MNTLKHLAPAFVCLLLLGQQSALRAGEQLKIIKPDTVDDRLPNVWLVGDSCVKHYQVHARDARLIWASTTPIWDPKTGKLNPGNALIIKRNAIAAKIMKEAGIPITDLYSAVAGKLELGGGIHGSSAGYGIMAAEIVRSIVTVHA